MYRGQKYEDIPSGTYVDHRWPKRILYVKCGILRLNSTPRADNKIVINIETRPKMASLDHEVVGVKSAGMNVSVVGD